MKLYKTYENGKVVVASGSLPFLKYIAGNLRSHWCGHKICVDKNEDTLYIVAKNRTDALSAVHAIAVGSLDISYGFNG